MTFGNVVLRCGFGAAMAVAATLAFTVPSQAALVSCPSDFTSSGTAKVHDGTAAKNTAASACQYITPANQSNVASQANVNAAGFFGFNDWQSTSVLQTNSNQSTGTWAIPSVDFANYDYMITFKSGQGTNLTSFAFNELYSSGGWSTPFTEPPFSFPGATTTRDVSHYSIFRRYNPKTQEPPTEVPEPAVLSLLGIGLLGLGMLGARRRRDA